MTPQQITRMAELEKYLELAGSFIQDVMPQVGNLAIQDYGKLNEMLMLQTKLNSEKPE